MYNELRTAVKTTNFWTSQFLVTNMDTCCGLNLPSSGHSNAHI